MDLNAIPKTFWHSISLAILVATLGLVWVAYRSGEVSIDFASKTVQISNAKADLAGALAKVETVAHTLEAENEALRTENEQLRSDKDTLLAQVSKLEEKAQELVKRSSTARPIEMAELHKGLVELRRKTTAAPAPRQPVKRPKTDESLREAQQTLQSVRQQVQRIQVAPTR